MEKSYFTVKIYSESKGTQYKTVVIDHSLSTKESDLKAIVKGKFSVQHIVERVEKIEPVFITVKQN